MKKLITVAIFCIVCVVNLFAKDDRCITIQQNPGSSGYDIVRIDEYQNRLNGTDHVLLCQHPGNNECTWGDGGCPCDPKVKIINAIPADLVLTDDNGNPLNIKASEINDLICSYLSAGSTNGHFIMNDVLEVIFRTTYLENGAFEFEVIMLSGQDRIL